MTFLMLAYVCTACGYGLGVGRSHYDDALEVLATIIVALFVFWSIPFFMIWDRLRSNPT
jgi:hypothetical protein